MLSTADAVWPDSKLMPRSIYDVLTQSSHDLQRLWHDDTSLSKHRTSCDVTIVDEHIAISMLKPYIVQPYTPLCISNNANLGVCDMPIFDRGR